MNALFVYITVPDEETARSMAKRLVEERLCACANILPGLESLYWWGGKVEQSREAALICKTMQSAWPSFEKRARELHPYDTPCIVALPLEKGFAPFMQWIADETRS
ncbi:MAG: divalent-cation tolerance protein CutA [Desulfovibrionaceae bacterium]|nr:divalent-cation tolerance protein CutA [Desulfovibrionaceae bacterium]